MRWIIAFLLGLMLACIVRAENDPWRGTKNPNVWRGARPASSCGCDGACQCGGACLCREGAPCECGCGKSAVYYWFPDLSDGGYFLRKGLHGSYVGYIVPMWNGDAQWVGYGDFRDKPCPAGMPEVFPARKNVKLVDGVWQARCAGGG